MGFKGDFFFYGVIFTSTFLGPGLEASGIWSSTLKWDAAPDLIRRQRWRLAMGSNRGRVRETGARISRLPEGREPHFPEIFLNAPMYVPRCTAQISHLSTNPRTSIEHLLRAENCKGVLGGGWGVKSSSLFLALRFQEQTTAHAGGGPSRPAPFWEQETVPENISGDSVKIVLSSRATHRLLPCSGRTGPMGWCSPPAPSSLSVRVSGGPWPEERTSGSG